MDAAPLAAGAPRPRWLCDPRRWAYAPCVVATEETIAPLRLFERLLRASEDEVTALLDGLDVETVDALDAAARASLATLPIPLFEDGRDPLTRERRSCQRLIAHL